MSTIITQKRSLIPSVMLTLALALMLGIGGCILHKFTRQLTPAQAKIAYAAEQEMLARGKEIWFDSNLGTNGRNCESCHPKGELTNGEAYPRYKHILRSMATLSMTHNFAVVNESKGVPWEIGSHDANALVLFVRYLANGKKIYMGWPQQYKKEWISRGKVMFADTSLGNNSKSCESCHFKGGKTTHVLDGKTIIGLKGQAATFPRYSLRMEKVVTLEQEIQYCLLSHLKSEQKALDNEDIIALTCYITSLSEGRKVSVAQKYKF
ncbi:MAG TPA: hypothetical protein ENN22_03725 [bacterium]|nr:hypothetical protein [bacterium]